MGLIVDGTVTGKIPERVAFSVNYPGYPSSMTSAIRTLGGEEAIQKARQSEGNFLELKFRPDDPYAHPAFGELRHTSDLVLRLSKNATQISGTLNPSSSTNVGSRQSRTDGDVGSQTPAVDAEIIARVEHTYVFEGMADYQYVVPVHASALHSVKRKDAEQSLKREKGSLLDIDDGEMMLLVPPLFSVKDLPEDLFLRPPSGKKKKLLLTEDTQQQENMHAPNLALEFKIKQIPPEGNWEHLLVRGSEPWLRTAALVRLFQERPIWTKSMLNERLMGQGIIVTDYYLRSLLFRIAYYFGNGPFRNLWIRNGYDPRLDPESRAHQMIDFRVPAVLRGVHLSPQDMWNFSDMCAFKAMPRKNFTQFQIIDLQDDDIQAQIERPPERTSCSETNGWFRLSTILMLRQIVRVRFLALYPGDIARELESAELKSLEQSKLAPKSKIEVDRSRNAVAAVLKPLPLQEAGENDTLADGDAAIATSQVTVEEKLKGIDLDEDDDEVDEEEEEEPDEDEDDEEDEDEDMEEDEVVLKANEEEDDEEEEELEDQHSQDEIAELEENTISGGHLDLSDNIPKNYLDALLGKLSYKGDDNNQSSAMDADEYGEYTIYEPDDDDDEHDG